MSTITESVSYDASVYQIDTTDPVQGGQGGIANKAAQNLANRTAYLKQHMDNLENGTTIPSTVAPKNSPIFTGDPQAPTPALGDNDTSIATSAFVQGTINGLLIKSVAGGSNVTLSAIEAGNGIWQFTGALTANIDVILPTPTPTKQMLVLNRTSGAYTLRVKTASGTGVYVVQGKQQELACDGTNVFQSTNDTAGLVLDPTVAATTAAQFDASTKLATTAFVQRALGSKQGVIAPSSALILNPADVGKFILPNGSAAFNVSLPLVSTVSAGAAFTFLNVCSQAVNVFQQGSDTITNGTVGGLSFIPLLPGDSLEICSNGLGWYATGGSAALAHAGIMASANFITPPQLDSSNRLATTAFARQVGVQFNNPIILSGGTGISPAGGAGNLIISFGQTGPITHTLPPCAQMPNGGAISFFNGGGYNVTIVPSQGDGINLSTYAQSSVVLKPGDTLSLSPTSSTWNVYGGSAQLPFAPGFGSSINSIGYQKLPSGLIIQWGANVAGSTSAGAQVNFPIAFPNACLQVVASDSGLNVFSYGTTNYSVIGFALIGGSPNNGSAVYATGAARWIAIGF